MNRWTPQSTGSTGYDPLVQKSSIDPTTQDGHATTVTLGVTTDNDELNQGTARVNQQRVLPVAIKNRLVQVVNDDQATILSVSIDVTDGASTIATLTSNNKLGGFILAQPYWQIFVDSHDANGAMPQSVSSKFFPFYFWNGLYDGLGASSQLPTIRVGNPINNQPNKSVHHLQVRNATGDGSTHRIYIDSYVRFILNGAGAPSSS